MTKYQVSLNQLSIEGISYGPQHHQANLGSHVAKELLINEPWASDLAINSPTVWPQYGSLQHDSGRPRQAALI